MLVRHRLIVTPNMDIQRQLHAFSIRTSKFWSSLIVLNFLGNFDLASIVLIFKSTHKNNNSKK